MTVQDNGHLETRGDASQISGYFIRTNRPNNNSNGTSTGAVLAARRGFWPKRRPLNRVAAGRLPRGYLTGPLSTSSFQLHDCLSGGIQPPRPECIPRLFRLEMLQ